jgi:hypothetical protein
MLAYLYASDTNKIKQYELGVYSLLKDSLITFGDSTTTKPFGFKGVNDKVLPTFFDYLPYVKLTLSNRVVYQKDTLLESEKVRLDLWSPSDLTLQPQQLLEIKDGDKSGDVVALHLADFKPMLWCPDSLQGSFNIHRQSNYSLVYDNQPYAIQAQWKNPVLNDVYRVNLQTGERLLLKKALAYEGHLSDNGRSFTYFEPKLKNHYLLQIDQNLNEICMSCAVNEPWEEDLNGQPMDPGPAATYGFNANGDAYYYASRDNIYEFDLSTKKNRCLTFNETKNRDLEWEWIKWNSDSTNVAWNSGYLQARNRETKKSLFGRQHLYFYLNCWIGEISKFCLLIKQKIPLYMCFVACGLISFLMLRSVAPLVFLKESHGQILSRLNTIGRLQNSFDGRVIMESI